jgi:FtsP/CotA-like multicopper oxidase with cupredoxin domain
VVARRSVIPDNMNMGAQMLPARTIPVTALVQPPTDAPVRRFTLTAQTARIDTVFVQPSETYDVVFRADNPGLWMLHCHMVQHDAHGMDMRVVYNNISVPF